MGRFTRRRDGVASRHEDRMVTAAARSLDRLRHALSLATLERAYRSRRAMEHTLADDVIEAAFEPVLELLGPAAAAGHRMGVDDVPGGE